LGLLQCDMHDLTSQAHTHVYTCAHTRTSVCMSAVVIYIISKYFVVTYLHKKRQGCALSDSACSFSSSISRVVHSMVKRLKSRPRAE